VKVHGVPKHARPGDYHAATGLEALFGYLYLMDRRDRLNRLFAAIVEEN
jgi:ribonuclease-3 family protein